MTTTPINIDFNGIQVNATNDDISITLTMDGADKGLIFRYDKTTGNPKTFKITSAGFNFTDNTTNYTTSLSNIALAQQVLASIQVPPNATTLQVNHNLQLTDNTTTADLGIASPGSNLEVNVNNSGVAVFNQCPQCAIAPTNTNDLVNKTYVDNNVYNITSVNNNQDYYPIFTNATGTGASLFVDSTTGPLSYNPSNGSISCPSLVIDQTNNRIRCGSIALTNLSGSGNNTIAFGTNTGINQSAGAIAIGQNAGADTSNPGQGINAIAIGTASGRYSQGSEAIAIGPNAGNTGQGIGSIAIGNASGQTRQGQYCVAIGNNTHQFQGGDYSIAIGGGAGVTGQCANSIVINASGANTNNGVTGSCIIRPIRGLTTSPAIGVGRLFYNTSTNEVAYSTN
jgi:hypothetical protein